MVNLHVRPKSAEAFTLAELLTTVAIIAVLATLGLSGLAKARTAAESARCAGNLRQIGTALLLYVGDEGEYPLQSGGGNPKAKQNWPGFLDAYTGTRWPSDFSVEREPSLPTACDTVNLYVCPGYRKVRGWFMRPGDDLSHLVSGAYGYNASGTGGTGLGGIGIGVSSTPETYAPVRESMVVSPSEMYVIGDAALWNNPPAGDRGWTVFGNAFDLGFNLSYSWNGDRALKVEIDLVNRRHAGRFVVSSADGHTENLKRTEFLDIRNPERLRRFSRDNIAHRENLLW